MTPEEQQRLRAAQEVYNALLRAVFEERTNIERFWHYSRSIGCNELAQPESLEDRLYSAGQEDFFLEYELQMEESAWTPISKLIRSRLSVSR